MTPTDEERAAAWRVLMRARAAERIARDEYRARSIRCDYRDRAIDRAWRWNLVHGVVVWAVVAGAVIGLLAVLGWPAPPVRGVISAVASGTAVYALRWRFVERLAMARRRHPEPDAESVLHERWRVARDDLTAAECDPATLPAEFTDWTASMQEVAEGLDVRDRYDPPDSQRRAAG